MSRFEMIGRYYINIDKIKQYWHEGEAYEEIAVMLEDGTIIRDHNKRCIAEGNINGNNHIIQIIPCIKPLYARYIEENEVEVEYPVNYLGLCASGYARPLDICGADGVGFADESCNYVGLYCETIEEEMRKEEWEQ